MRYPKIFKSEFCLSMDKPINSKVIREIFRIMGVRYQQGDFTAGSDWRVTITDQHEDEDEPHYWLEVGEGEYADSYYHATFTAAYCDYHSMSLQEKTLNDAEKTINQIMGKLQHGEEGSEELLEQVDEAASLVTSVAERDEEEGVIEEAPGKWHIDIWINPDGIVSDLKDYMKANDVSIRDYVLDLAKHINTAYAKAMEEALPDYFIVSSELF